MKEGLIMNKKKAILIIILIILIIIFIGISVIVNIKSKRNKDTNNEQEELTYNTNANFIEDKNIDGLSFTNINCTFNGEVSFLSFSIINQTKETIHLDQYKISIKDKDENILSIIELTINHDFLPNEEYFTTSTVLEDLTTAYSLEFNLENIDT